MDQAIRDKRFVSDIVDEWLENFDEYKEEQDILSDLQPYRQRFENTKVSDQDN